MPDLPLQHSPTLISYCSQKFQEFLVDQLIVASTVVDGEQPGEKREKMRERKWLPKLPRTVVQQLKQPKLSELYSEVMPGALDNAMDRGGGQ